MCHCGAASEEKYYSQKVSGGDRCPGDRGDAWGFLSRREASCISAPSKCRDGPAMMAWKTSSEPEDGIEINKQIFLMTRKVFIFIAF